MKKDLVSFFALKQYLYSGSDSNQLICTFARLFVLYKAKAFVEVLNKANGQMVQVHLKGNWFDRKATISIGSMNEDGILIATVSRDLITGKDILFERQTYYVTMAPGCDAAFISMLCIAMDKIGRGDFFF